MALSFRGHYGLVRLMVAVAVSGRQVIIEVALTATDGQTRTSHYDTNRPLRARYDQKTQKYANAAQALGYRLILNTMRLVSGR